jgi:hypothetical protein
MPWFKVPVHIWIEADEELNAVTVVLDELPAAGGEHPLRMIEGGPAEKLDDDAAARFLEFISQLEQSARDSAAGVLLTDPAHPGLRFTPAAAAQLMALEAENEMPG